MDADTAAANTVTFPIPDAIVLKQKGRFLPRPYSARLHAQMVGPQRRATLLGLLVLLSFWIVQCQGRDNQELEALFDGPFEVLVPATTDHYSRPQYDLSSYEAYDSLSFFSDAPDDPFAEAKRDDPHWVDGAARDVLNASMRRAQQQGESDYPSAALYLLSPSVYRERKAPQSLQLSYPPDGAVFPPNLCEIRIDWDDEVNDLWQVTVGLKDTSASWSIVTENRHWRFPEQLWDQVQHLAQAREAWIQVKGVRRPATDLQPVTVQATKKISFRTSKWAADNHLVYRIVVPPFNKRKTPSTYSRDISSFEVSPFLLARDNYCYNCHTFSAKTGTTGMVSVQVRYMSPGSDLPVYLGLYDIDRQQGWKAKLPFDIQMSTFMAWSPNGKFLAFSANQQLVTFSPTVFETQFAGQPTSDLAIYDIEEETAFVLPGADDPDKLELLPRWSMDGQRIVFSSAAVGLHPAKTLYDLYEIDFDDGNGGKRRMVPGATDNGRSNYFPRFSPDSKWLSFCQSDGGILMKSSSDIFLLPADLSGTPRRLESNVDYAADSWHSWSSDGHWLVFASKRDDGIYARLYLTEIDEEGHASPAIRLPLLEEPLASFNIPEFVAQKPRIEEPELFDIVRVEALAREVAALDQRR